MPDGKVTDFRRAVQAKPDETVVFSWVEWPDKATRDAGMDRVMKDPRMNPETNPMPFDGKRMIYGGFSPVVELGNGADLRASAIGIRSSFAAATARTSAARG